LSFRAKREICCLPADSRFLVASLLGMTRSLGLPGPESV